MDPLCETHSILPFSTPNKSRQPVRDLLPKEAELGTPKLRLLLRAEASADISLLGERLLRSILGRRVSSRPIRRVSRVRVSASHGPLGLFPRVACSVCPCSRRWVCR